jgi:transcriptional regulator with XRE-family HTH domain
MEPMINKKLMAVAENVRNKRLLKNYSQKQVAKKLVISQSNYSRIELAYTKVTIEMLYKIAAVLETSVDDLLTVNV